MSEPRSSDRNVDRAIRSWLHDDRYEDVSRVAGAVLDLLDTTPQRRSPWWPARRIPFMNKFVSLGLGAAAVVVALVIGTQMLGAPESGGVGGASTTEPTSSTTPSPTMGPTVAPTPTPTPEGLLPEGPHVILDGQADDPANNIPPLTVTIPAPGWYGEVGGGILVKGPVDDYRPPDGTGMIVFTQREYMVYGDACTWRTTVPDAPATTVDAFVAALSSQGSRRASEPVDITLGGYAGRSITLEVPDDVDVTACDPGYGGSWSCDADGMSPCGYHTGPEEIDTVYVLDIDGVIMAWQTGHHTGTSAEDVAELEAIVQSASFGE